MVSETDCFTFSHTHTYIDTGSHRLGVRVMVTGHGDTHTDSERIR